jgi:hypothetical protein
MAIWTIPEGLRVLPDGTWTVGARPVVHAESLRYLKAHLIVDDTGAAIVDGPRRMPITLDGPPLVVSSLAVDRKREEIRALLDDGSEEVVAGGSIGMNDATGRFECAVRGGTIRAALSRSAHQTLLDLVDGDAGAFFLRVGALRLLIRT